MMTEDRRQRTEGRRQKTEERGEALIQQIDLFHGTVFA
jgi:hypothetical protein